MNFIRFNINIFLVMVCINGVIAGSTSHISCITHQSEIFDTVTLIVDYKHQSLDLDETKRLLHVPTSGMIVTRSDAGKTMVESADNCASINFLDYHNGAKEFAVTTSGVYTFTPSSSTVVSIFSSEGYIYDATDPCIGVDSLIGSNYIVGQHNNTDPLTVTLSKDSLYNLILGASSVGASTVSINGPGTVIENGALASGTKYTFIAVDTTDDKIRMVDDKADFRQLTEGVYKVYGVSYLSDAYTPYWLGRTLDFALGANDCMILSSNHHMLTIIGCDIIDVRLTNIQCNDNGTDNSVDDFITFDIDPLSVGGGAIYKVFLGNKTIIPSVSTYGESSTFQLLSGTAGGGDLTITIEDTRHEEDNMCRSEIVITDPGSCSTGPSVCIAQESRIIEPIELSVVYNDESLDIDESTYFHVSSVSEIELSRNILGNSIVNFNGNCDTIDFLDHYIGTTDIAVSVTGEYTFTPANTAVLSIIDTSSYSYNALNPCDGSGAVVGSNYNVGGNTSQGALTLTLTKGKKYAMVVGASTMGTAMMTISGVGQVYQGEIATGSTAYTYIAVNDQTDKIVHISAEADFISLSPGDYKVYGVSYSESICVEDWMDMTISEIASSDLCIVISSNFHTIEVITCSYTSLGLHAISCNDNNTDNPLDDYISFKLNPVGNGLSTGYNIAVLDNSVTPFAADYDQVTGFILPSGTAGNGNLTLQVSDSNSSSINPCTSQIAISDPGICSTGEPICVSQPSILCNNASISSSSGQSILNFNSNNRIIGNATSSIDVLCDIKGNAIIDANGLCGTSAVLLDNGAEEFRVDQSGEYTFTVGSGVIVTVVNNTPYTYNPASPCSNIGSYIGSNFSASSGFIGTSLTVSLLSCESYQLVVSSNQSGMQRVDISGAGNIYKGISPTPGSDYTYLAINNSNDDIVAVNDLGDFRALSVGSYKVYGVSHLASINTDAWLGQKSSSVFKDPLCALKSSNHIPITIECSANTTKTLLPQDITEEGEEFHDGHIIAGKTDLGKVIVDVDKVVFRAVNSVEFHAEFELKSPNELTVEFSPCPNDLGENR